METYELLNKVFLIPEKSVYGYYIYTIPNEGDIVGDFRVSGYIKQITVYVRDDQAFTTRFDADIHQDFDIPLTINLQVLEKDQLIIYVETFENADEPVVCATFKTFSDVMLKIALKSMLRYECLWEAPYIFI